MRLQLCVAFELCAAIYAHKGKMYYIPIFLKCGIYVGYFSFYDFMWDTCGIDIFIVRICMWDKCGIGEKSKSFKFCGINVGYISELS